MHILRCTHGTEYEVRVHCSLYLSHSKSIITWSNVVNIHQFQIAIQLPQLRTWTHPFLWDVLRCGRPPSRAKHAKFTSSTLYAWLCMEKFYEQLVTRVIKMIKIKEFSGHSCQSLSYLPCLSKTQICLMFAKITQPQHWSTLYAKVGILHTRSIQID